MLDIGGGDGLLCRLLRDHGLDCYVHDKFAHATYAQGFSEPPFDVPDLVLAFEVFEHLPCPKTELETFFDKRPLAVLVSTEIYSGQGSDWMYLARESGQHVFFYTANALAGVGQRFGYRLVRGGAYSLFLRNDRAWGFKPALLRTLLRPRVCRLVAAAMLLRGTPGVMRDHEQQRLQQVEAPLKPLGSTDTLIAPRP